MQRLYRGVEAIACGRESERGKKKDCLLFIMSCGVEGEVEGQGEEGWREDRGPRKWMIRGKWMWKQGWTTGKKGD